MNLNGITNAVSSYNSDSNTELKKNANNVAQEAIKSSIDDMAAVYEPSSSATDNNVGKTYSQDTKIIAKLKADTQKRTEQLRSLVEKLLLKQGQKFTEATDIYELLREGKLKVDPETAAKAQEEISENGYWGVKQTSERLFDFATALTGGDPGKAQEMKDAFMEGYEQAKKAWGGELPEISQKTYEATIRKFDEWISSTQDM